jgi:hypothetical protein
MSADQRHAIRKEALERGPVVDIHELRRDEPRGVAVVLHPCRGEQEEVDVQARKPVDLDAGHLEREALQAFLVLAVHVVMADIGRIRQDEVWRGGAGAVGNDAGEVAANNFQASIGPQVAGGVGEDGIKFDADGALDALGAIHRERGGEETARADRWVGKADSTLARADQRADEAGDIQSEGVGRGELAEAVPLGCRLGCINRRLDRLALCFGRVVLMRDHAVHSPSFARSSMRCSHTQSIPSAAS